MDIKKWLNGAFLIAMGIVLPLGFHAVGMGGPIFLPMHIPVLIAGLMLGPSLGAAVGIFSVLLSTLLTGMPPLMPMMPIMLFELAAYGLLTGYLFKNKRKNIWAALLIAMVGGRVVAGIVVWILVHMIGFGNLPANPILFIQVAILKGLPGMAIQLVFIPVLFKFLAKADLLKERRADI